jgi:hypothetical protein
MTGEIVSAAAALIGAAAGFAGTWWQQERERDRERRARAAEAATAFAKSLGGATDAIEVVVTDAEARATPSMDAVDQARWLAGEASGLRALVKLQLPKDVAETVDTAARSVRESGHFAHRLGDKKPSDTLVAEARASLTAAELAITRYEDAARPYV